MSFSMPIWSRLAGLFIAMMPLVANANTGQIAGQATCPALLTEMECHDYFTAQRQARSAADRTRLEGTYASLLKERSRLCPLSRRP